MSYGAFRTPGMLEKIFPDAIWGNNDKNCKTLYLTFDDGPDPINTPAITETLKRNRIPATFFFKGNKIEGNEDLISRMNNDGFLTGYHGRTHATWWLRSKSFKTGEMDPTRLPFKIDNVFTRNPLLLRAPFGRIDPSVIQMAKKLNARIVQFRLVIGDWLPGKSGEILSNDLDNMVQAGDIVALHDGGRNGHLLPEILDRFIPGWIDKGNTFGSIKDLTS